jgi:hypothetical protein
MKPISSLLLCLVMAASGGCSSTQEIETSRPRAPETIATADGQSTRQAHLTVSLEIGESPLPEDIEGFVFRISEVHVHSADGEWIRLPSDMHQFEISQGQGDARRSVLDTTLPPAPYDSVAIGFDSVFARFNANAGAPLVTANAEPLRMAVEMTPSLETATALAFVFEPEASLRRSPDCRWFFVPVIRTEVRQ